MATLEIQLRTLTPLWTGGVDQRVDRIHETGLIGSLRWWYEALVRGLSGYACDLTSDDRCPDEKDRRCVACELLGCTGWARKFRLHVLDGNDQLVQGPLEKDTDFVLQFLELRMMREEEKWLLVKAVEIAAKYGSLGGKTTRKPQQHPERGADHGIVEWKGSRNTSSIDTEQVKTYLKNSRWRKTKTKIPDLRWFFFVQGKFLWRRQINNLIGLSSNGRSVVGHEPYQKFLQGRRGSADQPTISKKIFSFRVNNGRVWGYAASRQMRKTIEAKMRQEIGQDDYPIKTGEDLLNEL